MNGDQIDGENERKRRAVLIERYYAALVWAAKRASRRTVSAQNQYPPLAWDDALQEICMAFLAARSSFDPTRVSPTTWFDYLSRQVSSAYRRRMARAYHRRYRGDFDNVLLLTPAENDNGSTGRDGGNWCGRDVMSQLFERYGRMLRYYVARIRHGKTRRCLQMICRLDGSPALSYEEAAQQLGMSRPALNRMILRGVVEVQRLAQKDERVRQLVRREQPSTELPGGERDSNG